MRKNDPLPATTPAIRSQMAPPHIGLLIAFTTRGTALTGPQDLLFFRYTIPTFLNNRCRSRLTFYLGYDHDDPYFQEHPEAAAQLSQLLHKTLAAAPLGLAVDYQLHCVQNPSRSNPCYVWNSLAARAVQDGCEYLYQLGDDISFQCDYWDQWYLRVLQSHDNLGVTGCYTSQYNIITQLFLHRRHLEIFGSLFPPAFKNWASDRWVNHVYAPEYVYPIHPTLFSGTNNLLATGPVQRYEIDEAGLAAAEGLIQEGRQLLQRYLATSAPKK